VAALDDAEELMSVSGGRMRIGTFIVPLAPSVQPKLVTEGEPTKGRLPKIQVGKGYYDEKSIR
jgi:hypothetical protein